MALVKAAKEDTMKIKTLETLLANLRNEFAERIDDAEIAITINTHKSDELRWRLEVSDLCADKLYIWGD
jgi:hypothetical protein